jgi:hypothetical protein
MKKRLLGLMSLALPTLSMAATNLVVDGSFEAFSQASGTWGTYYGTSSPVQGWLTGTYGLEIRDNVAGQAFQGSNFAELDTNKNSWISQTIHLVAGHQYLLNFEFSNRTNTAVSTNGLKWSFAGSNGSTPAEPYNNSGGNQWYSVNKIITVNSTGNYSLKFEALGTSDSLGTSLDDISVTEIPEPGTASLLLGGLGLLGALGRKRRAA